MRAQCPAGVIAPRPLRGVSPRAAPCVAVLCQGCRGRSPGGAAQSILRRRRSEGDSSNREAWDTLSHTDQALCGTQRRRVSKLDGSSSQMPLCTQWAALRCALGGWQARHWASFRSKSAVECCGGGLARGRQAAAAWRHQPVWWIVGSCLPVAQEHQQGQSSAPRAAVSRGRGVRRRRRRRLEGG